jgi:serine/threonine-protein kinase
MGEVYLARIRNSTATSPSKFCTAQIARDQQRLHRFLQEARAAAGLSHPNIAHIYEIGEADGGYFIAMEYVEGVTLDQKMADVRCRSARVSTSRSNLLTHSTRRTPMALRTATLNRRTS